MADTATCFPTRRRRWHWVLCLVGLLWYEIPDISGMAVCLNPLWPGQTWCSHSASTKQSEPHSQHHFCNTWNDFLPYGMFHNLGEKLIYHPNQAALRVKDGPIDNYTRTTGVNQNCVKQTRCMITLGTVLANHLIRKRTYSIYFVLTEWQPLCLAFYRLSHLNFTKLETSLGKFHLAGQWFSVGN